MNIQFKTAESLRVVFVVRPFDTSLSSYLWRCIKSAAYLPSISGMFLLRLHQQTILGWWWLVIRVLLPTLGMMAVFQHVPSLQGATLPYAVYLLSGMALWTVITNSLTYGTRSLKQSRGIQAKLALPKLIFIIASGSVAAFYFTVNAATLAIILMYYYLSSGVSYVTPSWSLLLAPIPLLVCFLLASGIASFTSFASLFARDARLALGVITQCWFFLTPVVYGLDILPTAWRWAILYLNPVTPMLELFRWSLFGSGAWTIGSLATSIAMCLSVFLLGAWFLMRSEWIVREVAK
jgi:homopolymeric O-antigen transport system permease protein